MLKVPVYDKNGETAREAEVPSVFSTFIRRDLIRRAFLSSFTAEKQPQGRAPLAGKKVSVKSFGTGREMARLPRHSSGRAGFAPMARGGYKPHPPRVDENIHEEINKKERKLALASAIAATGKPDYVVGRGHRYDAEKITSMPLVVSDEFENLTKTNDAFFAIHQLGVRHDVTRVKRSRTVRAGKGKFRGRRVKMATGPLLVVSKRCSALRAFRNIAGVEVVEVGSLGVKHLAPGGEPGRLTLYTEAALKKLEEFENNE